MNIGATSGVRHARSKRGGYRGARGQRGFFLASLIAVVVLAGIILIAFSNRSSSPQTSSNEDRVVALNIIRVGGDLADAINLFAQDYSLATMTLDTEVATGLYDPAKAIAQKVSIPGQAMVSGVAADFAFVRNVAVAGAGSAANDDIVTLTDIREALCRRINNQVNNAALTAAIPTAFSGYEGCALVDSAHTYFKVVKAN